MLDLIIEQKMSEIAEKIFVTQDDPNQIPITQESKDKLDKLTPHWLKYRLDENNNPIAWVVVVPTTKEIAQRFLNGSITEKQILDETAPMDKYSALYLCSTITIPEHRNKGLATELIKEAIYNISKTDDYILFAWPFSIEGTGLIEKLNNEGFDIKIRTDGPKL